MDIESAQDFIVESYKKEQLVPLADEATDTLALRFLDRNLFPEPSSDATPIVIMPGYCGGPDVVRWNAVEIARLGRSVITLKVPPRAKIFSRSEGFPNEATRLTKVHASAMLRAMKEVERISGQEKFDILGYSYGALVALTAALAEPQRFRKIQLVNPAGFSPKTSYLGRSARLSLRFWRHGRQVKREASTSAEKRALYKEFSSASAVIGAEGGWSYTLQTMHSISLANLPELVARVLKGGIKVAVLAAENDPLFPPAEIKKNLVGLGVNIFLAPGAHTNVGFNPKYMARRYIEIFDSLG